MLGKLPVPGRPTILITVGQGASALAVGAGGGCSDIFTLICPFSYLSPSLLETARYRLKYCLKGPLNPKQPTNQILVCSDLFITLRFYLIISSILKLVKMCLTVCAHNQSVYLFSMVSLCCLLYTAKILKGERLKIITIIVRKVEHFYNAVMQPKWQKNTELKEKLFV